MSFDDDEFDDELTCKGLDGDRAYCLGVDCPEWDDCRVMLLDGVSESSRFVDSLLGSL